MDPHRPRRTPLLLLVVFLAPLALLGGGMEGGGREGKGEEGTGQYG